MEPPAPAQACPFPSDALPLPPVTGGATVPEQYALPHTKAIDLIGEEFVVRSLKTEPCEPSATPATRPSVVMAVASASQEPGVREGGRETSQDQASLVYCNLNDLDFASGSENLVYTSSGGMGGGLQEMVITTSSSGLLQMVQSVPMAALAQDKGSPYNAVSTILLQGGILQVC